MSINRTHEQKKVNCSQVNQQIVKNKKTTPTQKYNL